MTSSLNLEMFIVKKIIKMVSILLPTYNGERFLSQSIDSVLSQTFTEFELLIGLNGTTDNSRVIIDRYTDKRIRVFDYLDDKGKAKTLNKLVKESKYDLIALQDDDDIWIPTKLETQINNLDGYDVVGTFISYIDEENNIIGGPSLHSFHDEIKELSLCGNNQVANTSSMFKKTDALDIGGWSQNLDGIEDYDFWIRLMRNGKKFLNIPEFLVLHRIHKSSNFNQKKHDLTKIL